MPEETAAAMLNRAIEKQRELMRLEPTVSTEHAAQLAALEGARGSQRSRGALARSTVLEKEALAAQQAGRGAEAREKMQEALRLQREANANATKDELKDVSRESRLAQEVSGAEAEPLRAAVATALTLARSAIAQEKWEDAQNAYTEARKSQAELNQRFPATRYADVAALDKIDGELASLRAAGLAAVVTARERDGDAPRRLGGYRKRRRHTRPQRRGSRRSMRNLPRAALPRRRAPRIWMGGGRRCCRRSCWDARR